MTTYLLDSSTLIAAVVREHEHHQRVRLWMVEHNTFALCPIVEGALTRFLIRLGESHTTVSAALDILRKHPQITFIADSLSYADADLSLVVGHRQVTDAYLVSLAASRPETLLATLDEPLASQYSLNCLLVPRLTK